MSSALVQLALVQVFIVLVALGRAKGLAMLLGPASFGVTSTLDQIVLTAFSIGGLGVPYTALRLMSRAHSEGPIAFSLVGSRFLRRMIFLGGTTLLVGAAVLTVWPGLFGDELGPYALEQRLAMVGVLPVFMTVFLASSFAAVGKHTAASVSTIAINLGLAVAAVAGAVVGGVRGLYLATAAAGPVICLLIVGTLIKSLGLRLWPAPGAAKRPRSGADSQATIVGQAACFYGILVASAVAMLSSRTSVMAQLGEAATGQLQSILSIALTVGAVMYALGNVYLVPLLNRLVPPETKVATADAFVARMIVLMVLAAVCVALFPTLLIQLLYTAAFLPAAHALWLFVVWQCVYQVAVVYQQLLIGLDDVFFTAAAAVAAFAAAVALMSPLISWLGLSGVALAMTVGMLGYLGALLARLRWVHNARPSARVLGRLAAVLGLVAAAGVAGQMPLGPGSWLARAGVVGLVALWVRLGLDPDERDPRMWLRAVPSKPAPLNRDPKS